jgi:hypothetical protein
MLPGLEDFLQPKGINALKQAAVSGPIIILVSTNSICFALIVTSTKDVQCLRLPALILSKVKLLVDLSRGLSTPGFDFDTLVETRELVNPKNQPEIQPRLLAGPEGYINADPDDVFRELLAELWKNIVKPVFDALKLEVSKRQLCYIVVHICSRNPLIRPGYGGAQLGVWLSFPSMREAFMAQISQIVHQIMWFHPTPLLLPHCSTLLLM